MLMNNGVWKIDDGIDYHYLVNSKDKITLQRVDEIRGKRYVIELENCKGIEDNIISILSKQYIRKITEMTHLKSKYSMW